MRKTRVPFVGLVLAVGLGPCGNAEARARAAEPALVRAAGTETAAESRQRQRRDRGELQMKLGGVEWQASRAQAEIEGDRLELTASRLDGQVTEGNAVRQSIELHVPGYTGPGSYTISPDSTASLFLVVGLSLDDSEPPGEMDAEMVQALSQSKRLILAGAKVTIESADDVQVTGTFSWDGGSPAITDGHFRALIR